MLAVAAHDDNAVKLYNVLGGGVLLQAVASVPVGKQPTEMCIAPNGKYLFVSNAGDKNVSMIDVDSKTVTGQLADADLQSPDGCAVSPDSKKLYSVDQAGNAIFVFSTGSKQMLRKIAVGKEPRRAIFSPDGSRILVSNSHDDTLSVIDPSTDTVVKTIKTGNEPRDMTYSPDGKLLAVTLINDDCVELFKADTLEVKQQVAAVRSPQHMEFSPDSQRLYVLGKISDEVAVLRIGPLARLMDTIPVTHGPLGVLNCWGLAMSADGKFLYVSNFGDDAISVIDLQLMKTFRAFPGGKMPYGVVFIKPSGGVTGMGLTARLDRYRSLAKMAADAANKKDLVAATKFSQTLEMEWDEGEQALRRSSPDIWNQIDEAMDDFIHAIARSGNAAPGDSALNIAYETFLKKLSLAAQSKSK